MTGRLEGRTAIVTGASRGLGRAMALALAAEGAGVAVVARTEKIWDARLPGTIGDTVAEIEAAGGKATAVRADLLDPHDIPRMVDTVHRSLGPATILVNNAAFTAPGRPPRPEDHPRDNSELRRDSGAGTRPAPEKSEWPTFVDTKFSAYRRHFDIGVFAPYELMQLVAPGMKEAGGGAIINITSGASLMPGDGPYHDFDYGILPGYGGSKAALEHLTRCAAYDLQRWNVSVNALSPSRAIKTPGVSYYAKEFENYGSEAEFAEAAVRLAVMDPQLVTGRVVGHLDVLDGSFRPFDLP